MSRLSIDVTAEEHQKLKAMAALQGKSIKAFVLECTLGERGEDPALVELETLLERRIQRASREGVRNHTVEETFQQARRQAECGPDA